MGKIRDPQIKWNKIDSKKKEYYIYIYVSIHIYIYSLSYEEFGVNKEMSGWVIWLGRRKSIKMGSLPGTYMVERKNQLWQVVLWPPQVHCDSPAPRNINSEG